MNRKINNLCKILITSLGTISAISLTGTKIALENDGSINSFLGVQETVYTPNENADEQDTEYYKSKFNNLQDVIDNGRNLNRLVQQEGSVLLKNDNNALPLKEGNRKVSLVGVSSVDPAFSGTGSGSVDTSDAPSFKKAMENAGFEVNDTLWNFYSDNLDTYKRPNPSSVGGPVNVYNFQSFNYGTGDASWNDVNSNCGSSFSEYGDAAIYTITRIGGESHDIPSGLDSARKHDYNKTSINEDGDYLDLSDTEVDVLKGLKDLKDQKKIKNTVLIINSPNPMETDFLLDPELGIDACLWIGTPGTNGLQGVANLLAGEDGDEAISPSGSLPDTYYTDNQKYNPVMSNFGYFAYENNETYFPRNQYGDRYYNYIHYVCYQEGIYLGYKYTETRYEDSILNQGNVGEFNYDDVVSFPFGYGLSYTTFEFLSMKTSKTDTGYQVKVRVKNTGSTYGKKAVQVYIQKPYTTYDTENFIEKSSVELAGFGKTKNLAPNEEEEVIIDISDDLFKSYDAYGAKTYIQDAGDYYITAAGDSHEAINNILAYKGKTTADGMTENGDKNFVYHETREFNSTKYATSKATNQKVTNLFEHADMNFYDGKIYNWVDYLSRSDWEGTYPDINGVEFTMTKEMADQMKTYVEPVKEDSESYPTYGASQVLTLADFIKDENGNPISYDNPLWDKLLDQMTYEETSYLLSNGLRHTKGVPSVAKPETLDHNGPIGLTQAYGSGPNGLAAKKDDPLKNKKPTSYSCAGIQAATMNADLIEDMGEAMGEDALWAGYSGLYGPCSNIHRSPYEGRAFEYFSEDAVLSGLILASETKGIQSKGCYVYNKHFALNEQETNRPGVGTWANEQTIRENYLRAFELPITESNAYCVMSAYNRIGLIPSYCDYNLQTAWLRGETGMEGFNVSDYYTNALKYTTLSQIIMAGVDLPDADLNGNNSLDRFNDGKHGGLANQMRESAKRILYTVSRSNAMNGTSSGGTISFITPAWKYVLYSMDGVLVGLTVASIALLAVNLFNVIPTKKKEDNE